MRVEVRHVIRLRKSWTEVVVPGTEFEAQVLSGFPTIVDESLDLIESEEANRIVIRFAVSAEITQKRISKSIACGYSAAGGAGIKRNVAGINGASILIFSISNDQCTGLQSVFSKNPGNVITQGNIRGGRQQRSIWSTEVSH